MGGGWERGRGESTFWFLRGSVSEVLGDKVWGVTYSFEVSHTFCDVDHFGCGSWPSVEERGQEERRGWGDVDGELIR